MITDELRGVIEAENIPGTDHNDKHSPDYHLQRILERCGAEKMKRRDKRVDKAKPAGE